MVREHLEGLLSDVKHGMRTVTRSPSQVCAGVLSLSVGIIACTIAFSLLKSLFFRELPGVSGGDALKRVSRFSGERVRNESLTSLDELRTLGLDATLSVAAEGPFQASALLNQQQFEASTAAVSGNYFDVLGAQPSVGRLLNVSDDRAESVPVAVVSDLVWRRFMAADKNAVGRVVIINNRPFTIVGVASEAFGGIEIPEVGQQPGERIQVWITAAHATLVPAAPRPSEGWFSLVVRIPTSDSIDETRGRLSAHLTALARDSGDAVHVDLRPMTVVAGTLPTQVVTMLSAFVAVPVVVLVVGCANAASLQLARATARAREISIRTALGARRWQIIRYLTLEAAAIAFISGGVGIAGTALLLRGLQSVVPIVCEVDLRTLAFTLAVTCGTAVLSGYAPAVMSARLGDSGWLRTSRSSDGRHTHPRRILVISQIAFCLVLLTLASLFARSVQAQRAAAPAIVDLLSVGTIDLRRARLEGVGAVEFLLELRAHLNADTRVQSMATQVTDWFRYRVPHQDANSERLAAGTRVDPQWFRTVSADLVAGRFFSPSDGRFVTVIDTRMAADISPNASPIGHTILLEVPPSHRMEPYEVVGVVRNMARPPDSRDFRAAYVPMPAQPLSPLTVVVRTTDPRGTLSEMRRFVSARHAALSWSSLMTGETMLDESVGPTRTLAITASAFALVASLLTAAGLFALMSYIISLRRTEIAIRMVAGAMPRDVAMLVARQAAGMVVVGVATGITLMVPLVYVLRFLFEGVSPVDPVAVGRAVGLLVAVSLAASAVPAREAAIVDPAAILRAD